jgi:hypothetical protein
MPNRRDQASQRGVMNLNIWYLISCSKLCIQTPPAAQRGQCPPNCEGCRWAGGGEVSRTKICSRFDLLGGPNEKKKMMGRVRLTDRLSLGFSTSVACSSQQSHEKLPVVAGMAQTRKARTSEPLARAESASSISDQGRMAHLSFDRQDTTKPQPNRLT